MVKAKNDQNLRLDATSQQPSVDQKLLSRLHGCRHLPFGHFRGTRGEEAQPVAPWARRGLNHLLQAWTSQLFEGLGIWLLGMAGF